MPDVQLVLSPFHDYDAYHGWCPDCGVEQHNLIVNQVRTCDECPCQFTFLFEQLREAAEA